MPTLSRFRLGRSERSQRGKWVSLESEGFEKVNPRAWWCFFLVVCFFKVFSFNINRPFILRGYGHCDALVHQLFLKLSNFLSTLPNDLCRCIGKASSWCFHVSPATLLYSGYNMRSRRLTLRAGDVEGSKRVVARTGTNFRKLRKKP